MKKTLLFFGGLCTEYWLRVNIVPILKYLSKDRWDIIYCLSSYDGSYTQIEKKNIEDIWGSMGEVRFIEQVPPHRLDSLQHSLSENEALKDFLMPIVGDITPDIVIARTADSQFLNLVFPNILIVNAMEANFPPLQRDEGFILIKNNQPQIGLPNLDNNKKIPFIKQSDDILSKWVKHYQPVSLDSLNYYKKFIDELKQHYKKIIFFPFDCLNDAVLYFEKNTQYGSYKEAAKQFCMHLPDDYAAIITFHHIDLSQKSEEELKSYFPHQQNLFFINFEENYCFNQIKNQVKGFNHLSPTYSLVYLADHIIVMNSKTATLAMYYEKPLTILANNQLNFYPNIYPLNQLGQEPDLKIFDYTYLQYWLIVFETFNLQNAIFLEQRLLHLIENKDYNWGQPVDYEKMISLYFYSQAIELQNKYNEKIDELNFVNRLNQENFEAKKILQQQISNKEKQHVEILQQKQKHIDADKILIDKRNAYILELKEALSEQHKKVNMLQQKEDTRLINQFKRLFKKS